jgi:DnaJ-domain-containing protein 1
MAFFELPMHLVNYNDIVSKQSPLQCVLEVSDKGRLDPGCLEQGDIMWALLESSGAFSGWTSNKYSSASSFTDTPHTTVLIMGTDYYKLLGVDKGASEDEIKKAYKKMVRFAIALSRLPSLTAFCAGLEMASRP